MLLAPQALGQIHFLPQSRVTLNALIVGPIQLGQVKQGEAGDRILHRTRDRQLLLEESPDSSAMRPSCWNGKASFGHRCRISSGST